MLPARRQTISATRDYLDWLENHSALPAADDDVEQFPLLLHPNEVRELIDAARQQCWSAAGLARYLIRNYLFWIRRRSSCAARGQF
jgi:hypothetical protein